MKKTKKKAAKKVAATIRRVPRVEDYADGISVEEGDGIALSAVVDALTGELEAVPHLSARTRARIVSNVKARLA